MREVSLKFDGPLFDLPGGTVRMAIGGQHHYEEIDAKTFSLQPNNGRQLVAPSYGDRTVRSAFAELSLPIVGDGNAFTGVQGLQLSASARYDDYSDFGDTTNPKFGLNWTVVDGFTLRASSGKSFHAPSLADSNVATVDSRLQILPFFPFFPPGAPPGPTIIIAGGQPNLKPETADTWHRSSRERPGRHTTANRSLYARGSWTGTVDAVVRLQRFRYVQVECPPGQPTLAALTGEVLHSAVAETGSFESSNTLLNAIHAAARNTILNNLHGMQTDTPTYEQWLSASRRPPSTPRSCAISMTI